MRNAILALFIIAAPALAQEATDSHVESEKLARSLASEDNMKALNLAIANKDEPAIVSACNKILGDDPKNLAALNALAVHYYNQHKFGLAKIVIQRALNDYKDIPALYNNLGAVYYSEGEQKQAIGAYKKAIELKADYPVASANLGSIYLEFRDYKKAADHLGVAYEAVKSDLRRGHAMEVANNYAVALSGSMEMDHAKDVFEKIMKTDDSNPNTLYAYAVLLIARMKEKKEGGKIVEKLKFVADDSLQRKVGDLEKMLSGI